VVSFLPCDSAILGEPRLPLVEVSESCFLTLGRTPWTGGLPIPRPVHTQHRNTRTNIHAFSRIQTHNHSVQVVKTHALDLSAMVISDLYMVISPNMNPVYPGN
jgi:hypothetical protein